MFWEAETYVGAFSFPQAKAHLVTKENAEEFLESSLRKLGLTPKERNEMIVYWLPYLKKNVYSLVYFAGKEYTDLFPLDISPRPDSMLRVFMVIKPTKEYIDTKPDPIKPFKRKGFAVIEWGGSYVE